MAKNLIEKGLTRKMRRTVGRPKLVKDPELHATRDYLLALLENTWCEVGWNLMDLQSASEVATALQVWEKDLSPHFVVQSLLATSVSAENSKRLPELRREFSKVSEALQAAIEPQLHRKDLLEQIQRVLPQMSDEERRRVQGEVDRLENAVTAGEVEQQSLNNQLVELRHELNASYAYFARQEVVHFCESPRYRLNPLNTANALAGLPYIGWRQSARRCRRWKRDHEENTKYQIFRILVVVVQSCENLSELIEHAEQWLSAKRSRANAFSELKQHWYYLRKSIEAALSAKSSLDPQQLPYQIGSEYFRRTQNPSPIDKLLAENNRLA